MDGADKLIFHYIDKLMQIRFQSSPAETSRMNTRALRENFLVEDLMRSGELNLVYSHYDRLIIGGAVPVGTVIGALTALFLFVILV